MSVVEITLSYTCLRYNDSLENRLSSIPLCALYLVLLVLVLVVSDPLSDLLSRLLAPLGHHLVLEFDAVHQSLIECPVLHALKHENIPDHECKLLIIVELSLLNLLSLFIMSLLKSHWVEGVDQRTLNGKDKQFSKVVVWHNCLEGFYWAAVHSLLEFSFQRVLSAALLLLLLRIQCCYLSEAGKEIATKLDPSIVCKAMLKSEETFGSHTIEYLHENTFVLFLF